MLGVVKLKKLKDKELKTVERFRQIIRMSFQLKEVYTGEEVFEILKERGIL